jgi:hypothetical protein
MAKNMKIKLKYILVIKWGLEDNRLIGHYLRFGIHGFDYLWTQILQITRENIKPNLGLKYRFWYSRFAI